MNIDTLAGEGTDLKGRFKETLGSAVGNSSLQADGISDQVSGNVRKAFGSVRDFARAQPAVAVAAAVAVGLVLLRGVRGSQAR